MKLSRSEVEDYLKEEWYAEQARDCEKIQRIVLQYTGIRPSTALCFAAWSTRSDAWDASWLTLPADDSVWEHLKSLFEPGWEKRPGWVVDWATCRQGLDSCLCAVGWPPERQCADCREEQKRDSYCVCPPDPE